MSIRCATTLEWNIPSRRNLRNWKKEGEKKLVVVVCFFLLFCHPSSLVFFLFNSDVPSHLRSERGVQILVAVQVTLEEGLRMVREWRERRKIIRKKEGDVGDDNDDDDGDKERDGKPPST